MGIIHCQVSFFSRVHSWDIDYYAFGIGELQDDWRARMDPLRDPLRPVGLSYEIRQVD